MANQVLVVMGSDSDWPIMKNCIEILEMFAVHYEVQIASAHRTPGRALQLAKEAVNNFGVIIAGAGAAAHLPGVLAAVTPLPVIGVPIQATALQGVDALYSMVQMPTGVPVATVGIDGAKNAALLAVRILAVSDNSLCKKLIEYKEEQAEKVLQSQAVIMTKLREMS